VKGIEPSYSAWEAAALPLSYTRMMAQIIWRAGHVKINPRTTGARGPSSWL
jgi:hypothetical protein